MKMTKAELLLCFLWLNLLTLLTSSQSLVPQQEVVTVNSILTTMGATNWRFNGDTCNLDLISEVPKLTQEVNASTGCDCNINNNTDCHVVRITMKFYSLPGVLSPELMKLPYLKSIDFAYNYLNGTIPPEWGMTQLQEISVLGNRLTGKIPPELGNITTLTKLDLEANYLSGTVPSQLGRLLNLKSLILSSNQFTGTLPAALGELRNLTNFRINDNNFSGPIPDFIQNWRQLSRLEMVASGLEGPIPSYISLLGGLIDLRISDMSGPAQRFPPLNNASGLIRLILRNCNITGELPAYVWMIRELETLDVSFNRLVGGISPDIIGRSLRFVFLTSNMLSGDIPDSLLLNGASIDLSYNNFTWQGPDRPACKQNTNTYINLFKSSSTGNPLQDILACTENIKCPRYGCSMHINSGGDDVSVKENNINIVYEGDAHVDGGASRLYINSNNNWGLCSTGDFMDDNIFQNTRYITTSANLPSSVYATARLSPLSLVYFAHCLENGEYAVKLHFAELQFTNDTTYRSLGRRIFDIFIQGRLVKKNFNIEDESSGMGNSVVIPFNASVTNNILEIRFYWAGKGTTRFPKRGVYGPLVSAVSVEPYFKTCSAGGKKKKTGYVGIAVGVSCLVLLVLAVIWWKRSLKHNERKDKDFQGLELRTISLSLKQLKSATRNFSAANKIGQGGFGPVYKGTLSDGTVVAVKQLSSESRQGNREFFNEVGVISCLQHPNLVKLHGCCIEGDQLMLVYEYLENNSLSNALFGSNKSDLMLDWPTRFKICLGIARGLAFLHEESRLKIVHRDIKATNVLLDKDLNPKIADFGLARLNEDDQTHISTRVAGTIGYMAPEYALWGFLSDKADVYSFGVLALEIVSGKNNMSYIPRDDCTCLLDWACQLQKSKNYNELFDEKLGSNINKEEAEIMVKVALLCTNGSPSIRPIMSEVVSMLEGRICVPDIDPEAGGYTDDLRFKAMRDLREVKDHKNSQSQCSTLIQTDPMLSFSYYDHSEIEPVETR
ncbi:putative leucine-rich repeat receptor-like serine/threonine-protein kinase At3g14840 [Bidens hawaiensis]|uniref:putative leucine-rich repeat receptor-like serine/threonine-protein kinase At3g14840 n=1 Tax=Bidens hawaiensis TaxID=980011 RepID=UPI0040491AF3